MECVFACVRGACVYGGMDDFHNSLAQCLSARFKCSVCVCVELISFSHHIFGSIFFYLIVESNVVEFVHISIYINATCAH